MTQRFLCRLAAALAGAALCHVAQAQSMGRSGSSLIPYTQSGYVGLNVGQSNYRADCAPGLDCDDQHTAYKLYVGGMFNDIVGLELGGFDMGWVDRNAGRFRARGVNISLVGQVPMNSPFLLVGRLGTTWGRTNSESSVPGYAGTRSAWKPAWGVGVGYRFNPQWAVVLDYDQHRIEVPNDDNERVDAVTLGVRVSF